MCGVQTVGIEMWSNNSRLRQTLWRMRTQAGGGASHCTFSLRVMQSKERNIQIEDKEKEK